MAHERVVIEYRDLGDIHPYEDNPRDNQDAIASVANSIRTFGFRVPIVVNGEGEIIAGHTRYQAALRIGLTEVPCIVASNLTDDQVAQFRIIDNKVSELARWDMDLLSREITALQDSGIDLTDFGFRQEEIDCLSDIVANDCLENAGTENAGVRRGAGQVDPRAPSRTRVVIGEFVFFLPTEAYKRWAKQVRTENDFDEEEIEADLKNRLDMTPYLE
jgi:hypothetical protein